METSSALLALCVGNSPVTGEFPSQRPVTRSFGLFFDVRLKKRLSKQPRRWWFEMPSRSLWRHCNDIGSLLVHVACCGLLSPSHYLNQITLILNCTITRTLRCDFNMKTNTLFEWKCSLHKMHCIAGLCNTIDCRYIAVQFTTILDTMR